MSFPMFWKYRKISLALPRNTTKNIMGKPHLRTQTGRMRPLMDVTQRESSPFRGFSGASRSGSGGNEGEAYGLQVFQGLSEVLSDLQVYLEGRNVNLDSNIKVFARNTEDGTVFTM